MSRWCFIGSSAKQLQLLSSISSQANTPIRRHVSRDLRQGSAAVVQIFSEDAMMKLYGR
jgi:hypothetical protein